MAGAVAEQQARLAEVGRLVAAHNVRKTDDMAEAQRRTAALQTQLTALFETASTAVGLTSAASEAGLQARACEMLAAEVETGHVSYVQSACTLVGDKRMTGPSPAVTGCSYARQPYGEG